MNSTLKTLTILASGSIAAFVLASDAQALTFTSPLILLDPDQATPFPNPVRTSPFTKFDSTGKDITGVRVFLDGRLFGSVEFINPLLGGITRNVNEYTQRGNLRARGPSGVPTLIQVFPQQTQIPLGNPLALLPGISQIFNFDTSANQGPVVVAEANWGLFAAPGGGSGEVDWAGSASALSDIDNGIDVETTASLQGTFQFEVDYEEVPPPPPLGTPEPGTILGLLAVGTAGLASRRRQS